eukprot:COSAG01_NODE_32352_length_582_cov_26.399586_1_plen_53_part_10
MPAGPNMMMADFRLFQPPDQLGLLIALQAGDRTVGARRGGGGGGRRRRRQPAA